MHVVGSKNSSFWCVSHAIEADYSAEDAPSDCGSPGDASEDESALEVGPFVKGIVSYG